MRYSEITYYFSEKLHEAVSIKYSSPGDALDPEDLVSVYSDGDVQV